MSEESVAERATALLEIDRTAEALDLVGPAAASSADPRLHSLLIHTLLRLGRIVDAANAAARALSTLGPHPEVARAGAHAFLAADDVPAAVQAAQAGVEAAPQWVPGLLTLASAYLAAKQHDAAAEAVQAASELAPEEPEVHLAAADVALARNDVRGASRCCQTALRLDPTNVAALRGLGLLADQAGRIGQAARWYARALALRPADQELFTRTRGLFGRMLGIAATLFLVTSFFAMLPFLSVADPHPDAPQGTARVVFWLLLLAVVGAVFGGLAWMTLHGTPRAVLQALHSETHTYRRVRRCWRLTIAQAAVLLGLVVVAVLPIGTAGDRLALVLLAWLAQVAVGLVNIVLQARTFGRGGRRPAAR